jgi:hypothetical protein
MGSGSNIFGGASTGTVAATGSPVTPRNKNSFHNHSDSQINSTAKSGSLVGTAKKAISDFKSMSPKSKSSSGASSLGESDSAPTTMANLEF